MPYANRFVHLDFPELSSDDPADKIWVKLRNPKIMPPAELMRRKVKLGDDGEPDSADLLAATNEMFARLIVGWHVYDAMDPDDNAAPLGTPVTGALVAKLPTEIIMRIGEEIGKINPPKPDEPQEATTSNES